MRLDPPAVVIGSGLTALGVTRCLARKDIPVLHLGSASHLVGDSRWYRPVPGGGTPGVEEDAQILGRVLEAEVPAPAVLLPASDSAVTTITALPENMRDRYRAPLPGHELVHTLIDKAGLAEHAQAAGVPHPRTRPIRSEAELSALDDDALRNALFKPTDSQRFFRRVGIKGIPVSDRDSALRAFRVFRDAEMEGVLQSYVPGPPDAHLFVDGYRTMSGEIAGLLVRRRERIYPPTTGNSSSMVTVSEEEGATAVSYLRKLLDHTGFHGIFSAEFKEDAGDGSVRLLEVNVRPWWYVEFAARCGVDVCFMAYQDALDRPVERSNTYEVGRRCLYPYYDLFGGWSEIRQGRLSTGRWMRSWLGSDRPVFARDDPWPAIRASVRGAWSILTRERSIPLHPRRKMARGSLPHAASDGVS